MIFGNFAQDHNLQFIEGKLLFWEGHAQEKVDNPFKLSVVLNFGFFKDWKA